MSQHSSAQPVQGVVFRPAKMALVLASALVCMSASYAQESDGVPVAPTPIVTAPPLKQNLLVPQTPGQAAQLAAGQSAQATPGGSGQGDANGEAPWVLSSEAHPYPLRFIDALPMSSLYLDIPSVQESRLMLPGKAADMADRARAHISKYITDAIGVAAQARGRQMDALDNWLAQTERQLRLLPPDPWQQYQFNIEATRELTKFREAVANQTRPVTLRMVADVRNAVGKIAPVVNMMPTYELRTSWYNLMVQLKEGVMLLQNQAIAADAGILAKVDEYLHHHPAVPRPAGDPPPKSPPPKAAEQQKQTLPATAAVQPALKEAPKPAQQDSGSTMGGLIVMGGILAVVVGLFYKLRRRTGAPGKDVKTT